MVDSRKSAQNHSNVETVTALMRMKAKLVACQKGHLERFRLNVSK